MPPFPRPRIRRSRHLGHALASIREVVRRLGWRDGLLYVVARALTFVSGGRARLIKYYFVAAPVPDAAVGSLLRRPARRANIAPVQAGDPLTRQVPRPPDV